MNQFEEMGELRKENERLHTENRALREKGQALRDAFPDSSWQDSRERVDAADEWDSLAAAPGGEE